MGGTYSQTCTAAKNQDPRSAGSDDKVECQEDKPFYPRCNVYLTVEHVLLSYAGLTGKRAHYLGYILPPTSLQHLVDDSRWVQSSAILPSSRG